MIAVAVGAKVATAGNIGGLVGTVANGVRNHGDDPLRVVFQTACASAVVLLGGRIG